MCARRKAHLRRGIEKRETEAAPPRLDDAHLLAELLPNFRGVPVIQPEQNIAIWPRARAASPGLHAEQVVQESAHEVVVQVPAAAGIGRTDIHVGKGRPIRTSPPNF